MLTPGAIETNPATQSVLSFFQEDPAGNPLPVYPTLRRVDTISFDVPYLLTGFWFSCSIEFDTAGSYLTGAFLVAGKNPKFLGVSNSAQILCSFQNLANNGATGKSNWVSMADSPLVVGPGFPISLYACGETQPGNPIICIVSLQLARPPK